MPPKFFTVSVSLPWCHDLWKRKTQHDSEKKEGKEEEEEEEEGKEGKE